MIYFIFKIKKVCTLFLILLACATALALSLARRSLFCSLFFVALRAQMPKSAGTSVIAIGAAEIEGVALDAALTALVFHYNNQAKHNDALKRLSGRYVRRAHTRCF